MVKFTHYAFYHANAIPFGRKCAHQYKSDPNPHSYGDESSWLLWMRKSKKIFPGWTKQQAC